MRVLEAAALDGPAITLAAGLITFADRIGVAIVAEGVEHATAV